MLPYSDVSTRHYIIYNQITVCFNKHWISQNEVVSKEASYILDPEGLLEIRYLCLFLFLRFLWLLWWLPEEDEAAFWGFRSCRAPSASSVSSWLGSFSWFWRSGDVSLSVPLPGSPEKTEEKESLQTRNY